MYKIGTRFKADVILENNIEVGGSSYLVIYGKHINGYFCAIPNWNISCEMSSHLSVGYNAEKLEACGIDSEAAVAIVKAIREIVEGMK